MKPMAIITLERDAALATAGRTSANCSRKIRQKNRASEGCEARRYSLSLDAFDEDDAKIPTKNIN